MISKLLNLQSAIRLLLGLVSTSIAIEVMASLPPVSSKEIMAALSSNDPQKSQLFAEFKNQRGAEGNRKKVYGILQGFAFDKKQTMAVRWNALSAMAEVGGESAIKDMQMATRDSDWYMRNAGLLGLAELDPVLATYAAEKLISDKALVVRSAAVAFLTRNPKEMNRELLRKELDAPYNFRNGKPFWIRQQILDALR